MSQLKDKMIPGEALLYERVDGVVYARYRDAPHNTIPRAQGDLINYAEWLELCELSIKYPTLRKLLDTLVNTYYIIKEEQHE